jgi:hypothetical protein
MSQTYDVYIYRLTNGTYVIYPAIDAVNPENECRFVFWEWFGCADIECLVLIRQNVEAHQIDGIVHQSMHEHGIEKVRGGRYVARHLADSVKETISESIKYFTYEAEKNTTVAKKYTAAAITDIDANLVEVQYKIYNELETQCKNCAIDRCLVEELEWLAEIMREPVRPFFEIQERYYCLMKELGRLYQKYIETVEDAPRLIGTIYKKHSEHIETMGFVLIVEEQLRNPILYFDSRVIWEERMRGTVAFNPRDELVLDIFTLVIYTFINREDELLFEMSYIDIEHIRNMNRVMLIKQTQSMMAPEQ